MKKSRFEVLENIPVAKKTFRMVLCGDTSEITRPGQFVNIALSGFYLRRPLSVCDRSDDKLTLLYKLVGDGTEYMSTLNAGSNLDVLSGLGNGFNTLRSGELPLLVGGGMGAAPMLYLAKTLISEGKTVSCVLGFAGAEEIVLADELSDLGVKVLISTADGSVGTKGFVTDVIKSMRGHFSYCYACGPEAMLHAVYSATFMSGEYSFEERMGCGFGACMGCTCKTKYGDKRICKDGPVLQKEEIIW